MKDLIYGKDQTERVVCVEPEADKCVLFIETAEGVETREVPNARWLLFHHRLSPKFQELEGAQHYRYLMEYTDDTKFSEIVKSCRAQRHDFWTAWNPKEAFLLRSGVTYYKGMRTDEVSVLSFDIETTGLTHDKNSRVLLISNTFRKGNQIERVLFSLDDYGNDQGAMLYDWSAYVYGRDPSIILGHNILGFDLPYIAYCAHRAEVGLSLGRDGSWLEFEERTSEKRKDGSQSYTYNDVKIYGREVVDTFFLALNYDNATKRGYESYGLKAIVKHEGLERPDRQHYDASLIRTNWNDPVERKKIKAYAIDDADDALKLFDLMVPAFFYFTRSVPKSFQKVINSASGSQVNSVMVRAYLQEGHSLPKSSPTADYQGAISFGNPGVYKHVYKVDVASLYPSIMRTFRVYDEAKDPKGYFLELVDAFTEERLENKRKAKETNDAYYKGLDQAGKIFVNSAYGFLAAPGALFNSPGKADFITRKGREILQDSVRFATGGELVQVPHSSEKDRQVWEWRKTGGNEGRGYTLVNADTDSISYTNGKKLTDEEFASDLAELNSRFEGIRWEDDGYYKKVLVVAVKNYVLEDAKGNLKFKGSALTDSKKEKALLRFTRDIVGLLLKGQKDRLMSLYFQYVREAGSLTDITEWCTKKTVTKSVLSPERTNEQRVLDAIRSAGLKVAEGDKIYTFFEESDRLALRESFTGVYDRETLYSKLHSTLGIFENLIDVGLFPDLTLKRNADLIPSLVA